MSKQSEVAAELYGLPPEEFTQARNERARRARQDGDRALAEAIGQLGKPTAVGALANQLVRAHGDEIRALLDLGESLRAATRDLDGEQLRELSRQRQRVVAALVQQARDLAGRPVTEATARGLADTLHAALADAGAAARLAAGQLTGALESSGFPGSAPPAPKAPARTATPKDPAAAAEGEVRTAQAALAAAEQERDRVQSTVDDARRAAGSAADRVAELRRQLDEATGAHTEAERAVRTARKTAEQAEHAVQRARRRYDEATARRDRAAQ